MSERASRATLRIETLVAGRWDDFVALFGTNGACGGCWCMTPVLTRAEYERGKGDANRNAMRRRIDRGEVPGVLAYQDGAPAGWCSLGPRERFSWLARSRILRPVDDRLVWSVVCFFVRRDLRGRGIGVRVLEGAVAFARAQGATIVEGYPVEPRTGRMPAAFAWTGFADLFLRAGFHEVARRAPTRPIMRRALRPPASRGTR